MIDIHYPFNEVERLAYGQMPMHIMKPRLGHEGSVFFFVFPRERRSQRCGNVSPDVLLKTLGQRDQEGYR